MPKCQMGAICCEERNGTEIKEKPEKNVIRTSSSPCPSYDVFVTYVLVLIISI